MYTGTPNFLEISSAHAAHCLTPPAVELVNVAHAPLPDTTDENGPYVVAASATPAAGASIVAMDVFWSTDEGATFSFAPMAPSRTAGTFVGRIPGVASPETVHYYVRATDDLGLTGTYPSRAPAEGLASFAVGIVRTLLFDDFEGPSLDWTHAAEQGVDDWQLAPPSASATIEPTVAYSGARAWGNDLGAPGDGLHSLGPLRSRLRSPAVDCARSSGVRLRYARWLTVDEHALADASVTVGESRVWTHPVGNGLEFLDTQWKREDLAIGDVADGHSEVRISFLLDAEPLADPYGGWTVDDVHVFTVEPVGR
jgi:hypothetical protein